jgi:hypothetical protein
VKSENSFVENILCQNKQSLIIIWSYRRKTENAILGILPSSIVEEEERIMVEGGRTRHTSISVAEKSLPTLVKGLFVLNFYYK